VVQLARGDGRSRARSGEVIPGDDGMAAS
jgi:hypothetical protein